MLEFNSKSRSRSISDKKKKSSTFESIYVLCDGQKLTPNVKD